MVVVLSTSDLETPAHLGYVVRRESGSPKEIVERLARAGMQHLYIDGGVTIQAISERETD
ncbi:hypothetical protein [Thioalkalivibrio paradoxus]|uniref:hypothetical protein n=1 Tax=Thioalkalivibrio paradoxus TaxID=108010 RepID=UPI0018DC048A|nr:hypothetical protein [Thioalkalivibrio paradoxus]